MKAANDDIPLLHALDEYLNKDYAYFAIPGHRYERGMPKALADRIGKDVYRYDLTESFGLDDLHDAKGVIKEAQEAAAKLFGADFCRFSVNGTTALIEAMILACAGPDEEIVIARDAHRSAVSGLILSGARPVWLMPEYDKEQKIFTGIRPGDVERILNEHPKAKAVLIVHPTYYGQASDVPAIADVCHAHKIPLLADSAHGTHFAFSRAFPPDCICAGADLTAMSLHKTAGSMTQTSMLFGQNTYVSLEEESEDGNASGAQPLFDLSDLDAALRMTISSSPSYVLMASLDAARDSLQKHGEEEAEEAVNKALDLRRALGEIPGVTVRGGSDLFGILNRNLDVTRVVFGIRGMSGTDLRDHLAAEGNAAVEMADADEVVSVVTAANSDKEILQLSMAAFQAAANAAGHANDRTEGFSGTVPEELFELPEAEILPRDAFFAEKEEILLCEAKDRICAEILCPYPPGIPVLVPGEKITERMISYIESLLAANIPVQGLRENGQIKVVAVK